MYIRPAFTALALAVSIPAFAQTAGNTPNTGPQGTGNFVSGGPAEQGPAFVSGNPAGQGTDFVSGNPAGQGTDFVRGQPQK
jgi:hypothetical protein